MILAMVLLAGRHAVIMKRDIKDAFRNIPIAPHQQWLLGFSWKGSFYKETCLPFGLATAPFLFNLFAEAFHWILQSYLHWGLMEHYLDDFIHVIPAMDASPVILQKKSEEYILLTNCLGIPRNDAKDCVGCVLTVLGIEVDTHQFVARLPQDKLNRALKATASTLAQQSLTLKEAQSLTGFLSFCAPVVRLGWVFMRRLWSYVASFPFGAPKAMKQRIPALVMEDIRWWNSFLQQCNGTRFFSENDRDTVFLYTDASGVGMGGFFLQSNHHYPWDVIPGLIDQRNAFASAFSRDPNTPFDINIFEVQAILLAFQTWAYHWKRMRVVVSTDSSTAQRGLRKNTLAGPANEPLRSILLLAAEYDIVIEPRWISGRSNTLADALSRFDWDTIANLCPHWQNSFDSMLLPLPG
jgi:hypothetical protein